MHSSLVLVGISALLDWFCCAVVVRGEMPVPVHSGYRIRVPGDLSVKENVNISLSLLAIFCAFMLIN